MLQSKLSKQQEDILYLCTKEFLTPKQIALRRKTSLQAVYKTIKKLKNKGYLKPIPKGVENYEPTFKPPTNQIRLHGIELNIKILYKDEKYLNIINKSNLIYVDGNTIKLYKNSIEVYITKSFYAQDANKATVRSVEYLTKFLNRLENDLKLILVKPRSQNIKIVNNHYAEINNELAEECYKKSKKIRIYTKDDGKLWFTIDNSFNLHEAETLHPTTAKDDMQEAVQPFFNDLRDNKPPTLSEIMILIKQQAEVNKETAAGLNSIVQLMKPIEDKVKPIGKTDKPNYVG